jgi:membrane-bound metal-dependent hydrolase YbcI (DUF457 family)
MFIGHYGVALGLKKANKGISLGLLFLAVQAVDILWTVFVLLGIEKVEIAPGVTAANPLNFVYYPFTHSLLMSVVWAGVAYCLFRFAPFKANWQKGKVALIMGTAVLSHFFLDLIVHYVGRSARKIRDDRFRLAASGGQYAEPFRPAAAQRANDSRLRFGYVFLIGGGSVLAG